MTREQIEKAAGEYSGSVLGFKDNPVVMNKHKAFMDGAQWRINSAWHDASEKPNGNNKCLVELRIPGRRNPTYKLWTLGWENSFVTRWAYIDDLLPDRKEETE